jgi:hypothetical protein
MVIGVQVTVSLRVADLREAATVVETLEANADWDIIGAAVNMSVREKPAVGG